MSEYCTCGTRLVEGARFCHRCGRPVLNGEPIVEPRVQSTPPPPPVSAREPLPVGFGNPVALRVAFLMSIAVLVIEMIPVLQLLFIVWCLMAGWGAVRLYRRITGLALTPSGGARLGSITGVLTFLSFAIIMALAMLFNGKEFIQQMVRQNPQVSQVINNPAALVFGFLFGLAILFAMVVGSCAAGGALGARSAAGWGAK